MTDKNVVIHNEPEASGNPTILKSFQLNFHRQRQSIEF